MSLFGTGIRPIIDDYLVTEASKERDYGDYWSASSAGYCQRKLIFERLGVPPVSPPDPRKQRVFTAGHIFHDWIQKLTREAGVSVAQEVELQDEDLMIRGHFDDLVLVDDPNWLVGGRRYEGDKVTELEKTPKKHLILYDYKTVNSQSFKYKNDLSYYHKMQLGTYMYMLRTGVRSFDKPMGKDPINGLDVIQKLGLHTADLSEARILLLSKDDLRMKEQQLLWSEDLESLVKTYWNLLNNHWKAKKIPPCTCADHENGFLAREAFNPFFYEGEPCSLSWYSKFKESKEIIGAAK